MGWPVIQTDDNARSCQTVAQLVVAQALSTPGAIAAVCGAESLRFDDLVGRSRRFAGALKARGVERGMLVGIHLERSIDALVALMGTMMAGAAYVPLDLEFPAERLDHMVGDAGLQVIVTQASLMATAPRGRARLLDIRELMAGDTSGNAGLIDESDDSRHDLAYVLYTSGSSGMPKGVAVEQHSVVNFLLSMQQQPGMYAGDRLLAVTTLSFDIAGLELYLPLACGATVIIATREEAADGHALLALIRRHRVNIMQATPSTWRMLLDAGWKGGEDFRALCGGEAMPLDLAQQLAACCGQLWNLYGPTETTIWSSLFRVPKDASRICIGRPIANTRIYVLDSSGRASPIGVPGEICIAGAGVARGYLNNPGLSAERFVQDPFSADPDARMYRTGDQGRYLADGNLEYRNRLDGQVKLRGFRIELGEIEYALLSIPGIRRAVVMVREDRPGDVRLVGYVVAEPGVVPDTSVITMRLRATLPGYMVPQHLVTLDSIPLLPNGKTNHRGLPAPSTPAQVTAPADIDPSLDPRIAYLSKVWTEILGSDVVAQDNFFDAGGHSMLAVQMANRVARETGHRLKLLSLATQTLAQIALTLPATGAGAGTDAGWRTRMMGKLSRMFEGATRE